MNMGAAPSPGMSLVSSAQAGAAAATAILAGRAGQTPQGDMASLVSMGQVTPEKQQDANAGSNRIYVGNVPFGFSSEDLKKIFVCFGSILTCQLLPSQENPQQHRGYGFIEFASPAAAKLAIDTMNGFEVVGKQLKVNYATALRSAAVAGSLGVGAAAGAGKNAAAAANAAASQQQQEQQQQEQQQLPLQQEEGSDAAAAPAAAAAASPAAAAAEPAAAAAAAAAPFPEKPTGEPGSSNVLLLTNTVAAEEVDDDLKEEMQEECRRYGEVLAVRVEVIEGEVKIFVVFAAAAAAAAAAPQLHGRWFGGRQIHVTYYDEAAYNAGNYTL
ncbi:RNA-binding protein, putative [Eimeria mitis]|uniref:RNA-binding protein, putative n=1 Tax=Eimeria mitis TaxID=44415 RepID=U6K766_9EIME|nr:RNA-binding protein, putative [Eimeria mitis]CDJ32042.1 RNA-binding protein, putative [Eimeria mitis]